MKKILLALLISLGVANPVQSEEDIQYKIFKEAGQMLCQVQKEYYQNDVDLLHDATLRRLLKVSKNEASRQYALEYLRNPISFMKKVDFLIMIQAEASTTCPDYILRP
jgi:predicted lipid-binding transport protein (Tim44 family)